MINLRSIVALAAEYGDDLDHEVVPLRIGSRVFDTDLDPVVMGVVNLSRDSTYRTSVATSTDAAIRRGRVLAAQGAHLIDLGAESSNAKNVRVDDDSQIRMMVPVIEELAADGIAISVESYSPATVQACLAAGARVVNLTGSSEDDAMFALAAEHDAAVVLCHVYGDHARALDADRTDVAGDPVPELLEGFAKRLEVARGHGVRHLTIDPGLGFGFRTTDHVSRARHQSMVLMNSFRLRALGVPICHSLPHSLDFFQDEFGVAEGFYTVLAHLGGTGVYRTHEVPQIVAVLGALGQLEVSAPRPA